jgi:hypothetical protein
MRAFRSGASARRPCARALGLTQQAFQVCLIDKRERLRVCSRRCRAPRTSGITAIGGKTRDMEFHVRFDTGPRDAVEPISVTRVVNAEQKIVSPCAISAGVTITFVTPIYETRH